MADSIDLYVQRLSSASSLQDVPGPPTPSNSSEVDKCYRALTAFLDRHPTERDAVLQVASKFPSASKWSAQLLDWAQAPGAPQDDIIMFCVASLMDEPSAAERWFKDLRIAQQPRMSRVFRELAQYDAEAFLAYCERSLRLDPESRLDICVMLLDIVSQPSNRNIFSTLAKHSALRSLLDSLLYDVSNQVFAIVLRLFTLVIPYALASLTNSVPLLMVVLGRAVNWRDRPFVDGTRAGREGTTSTPRPIESTTWKVLHQDYQIDLPSHLQPHAAVRMFLATVYNAWPSNILAFVRDPVPYIQGKQIEPIYNVPWPEVWPIHSLAERAGPLLCKFQLHPSLVEHTSTAELEDKSRWDKVDPSEFTARAHALAHAELLTIEESRADMTEEHKRGIGQPSHPSGGQEEGDVSRLCREVDLLRAEQRHSQQLQDQYLSHIGRLHQETLRFDFEEAEINGMAMRLKDQSKTIETLNTELAAQHHSATKAHQKHVKWQGQLRDRLGSMRDERKAEQAEAVRLRSELSEAWAIVKRQSDELALEKNERAKIENEALEMRPKVLRIGDYETRNKQLTDSQRLWDSDVKRRKEAEAQAKTWETRYHQLNGVLSSTLSESKARAELLLYVWGWRVQTDMVAVA
ncbi:hypothetical protein BD324DRAFT_615460 [Kockovaella imperatae]|uniref:Hamartin protein-domain-containing protein n=1 Tax=Kockovaella imperatae TaxID=4999 RepID=A0A1Y1UPF1_9TREE|nr:hypothetical protein BD324DRAFT_615460 [Kockovaella imperatae]ORX39903.1 hypothetical protein BD324DRAFT_615460 [Kockovaella imperatae]